MKRCSNRNAAEYRSFIRSIRAFHPSLFRRYLYLLFTPEVDVAGRFVFTTEGHLLPLSAPPIATTSCTFRPTQPGVPLACRVTVLQKGGAVADAEAGEVSEPGEEEVDTVRWVVPVDLAEGWRAEGAGAGEGGERGEREHGATDALDLLLSPEEALRLREWAGILPSKGKGEDEERGEPSPCVPGAGALGALRNPGAPEASGVAGGPGAPEAPEAPDTSGTPKASEKIDTPGAPEASGRSDTAGTPEASGRAGGPPLAGIPGAPDTDPGVPEADRGGGGPRKAEGCGGAGSGGAQWPPLECTTCECSTCEDLPRMGRLVDPTLYRRRQMVCQAVNAKKERVLPGQQEEGESGEVATEEAGEGLSGQSLTEGREGESDAGGQCMAETDRGNTDKSHSDTDTTSVCAATSDTDSLQDDNTGSSRHSDTESQFVSSDPARGSLWANQVVGQEQQTSAIQERTDQGAEATAHPDSCTPSGPRTNTDTNADTDTDRERHREGGKGRGGGGGGGACRRQRRDARAEQCVWQGAPNIVLRAQVLQIIQHSDDRRRTMRENAAAAAAAATSSSLPASASGTGTDATEDSAASSTGLTVGAPLGPLIISRVLGGLRFSCHVGHAPRGPTGAQGAPTDEDAPGATHSSGTPQGSAATQGSGTPEGSGVPQAGGASDISGGTPQASGVGAPQAAGPLQVCQQWTRSGPQPFGGYFQLVLGVESEAGPPCFLELRSTCGGAQGENPGSSTDSSSDSSTGSSTDSTRDRGTGSSSDRGTDRVTDSGADRGTDSSTDSGTDSSTDSGPGSSGSSGSITKSSTEQERGELADHNIGEAELSEHSLGRRSEETAHSGKEFANHDIGELPTVTLGTSQARLGEPQRDKGTEQSEGNTGEGALFLKDERVVFAAGNALFGPKVPATPQEALCAAFAVANPPTACQGILNARDMVGKIAVIDRGGCSFQEKAYHAQVCQKHIMLQAHVVLSSGLKIAVIDRGGCSFQEKAYHAQVCHELSARFGPSCFTSPVWWLGVVF